MPASVDASITGYLAFAAIKTAGYSLFALGLRRIYRTGPHPIVAGATRAVLGMAVGGLYWSAWSFTLGTQAAPVAYLAGLIPIRLAEWGLLIWLYYDRPLRQHRRNWTAAGAGTVWSYVCDLPAALGFLATGGLSIC